MATGMGRNRNRLSATWCIASVLGLCGVAMGQPASGKPFQIYWNTTTNFDHNVNPTKTDWRLRMNLDGLPERHDIVIIYEQHVKEYDKLGPMKYWTKKGFKKYLQSLKDAIDQQVPDPDFSGIVIIDYEAWGPKFAFAPEPVRTAWKAEQLKLFPQLKSDPNANDVIAENYEKLSKGFWLETIKTAKAYRPKAKWGYYDWPQAYQNGEYGKPDPNPARQHNDEWKWLFDEMDVLCPSIYEWKVRVPEGKPGFNAKTEWTPAQQKAYHLTNLREAKRLANGRPVLPYVCSRYHDTAGKFANAMTDEAAVDEMIQALKAEGVDGIIFWGSFNDQTTVNEIQGWVDDCFTPLMKKHGLIDADGTLAGEEEEGGSAPVNKEGKAMPLPGGKREKKRPRQESGVWTYPNGNYEDR